MAFSANSARARLFLCAVGAAVVLAGCASSPMEKSALKPEAAAPALPVDVPSGTKLEAVLATPGLFPIQGQFDFGKLNALAAPPALLRVAPESLPPAVKAKTSDCWILAAGYGYANPESVRFSTDLFFCSAPTGKEVFEARFTGAVGSETIGLGVPGIADEFAAPAVYRLIGIFAKALPNILPTSLTDSSYSQAIFDIAKVKAGLYRRLGDRKSVMVGIEAGAPVTVLTLEGFNLQKTPLAPRQ